MRKICLTVFLIFSASLILSAGSRSGSGILLQTPPPGYGADEPLFVKELPLPIYVDPTKQKEPLSGPASKFVRGLFLYYYQRIGGILRLEGFHEVRSYTLTNQTTGQSQSVEFSKYLVLSGREILIPVSEDGVYQLSFQTRAGCYVIFWVVQLNCATMSI